MTEPTAEDYPYPLPELDGLADVEAKAIAAAFYCGEACRYLMAELADEDFSTPKHGVVLRAIRGLRAELRDTDDPLDLALIYLHLEETEELSKVGGLAYLAELYDLQPYIPFFRYYCGRIREASQMRRLRETGVLLETEEATEADELLGFAMGKLDEIAEESRPQTVEASEVVGNVIDYLLCHRQVGGGLTGITSGISGLDELTNGWQEGELTVIGARPSVGKTAMGLVLARNASLAGFPVLYFSLEMSSLSLLRRMVASVARVDLRALTTGSFDGHAVEAMEEAEKDIKESSPIFIDDSCGLDVQQISARAHRAVKSSGVRLVVIDHMHLLSSGSKKTDNQTHEVTKISAGLKFAAKRTGVPFLVLAQLNRNPETKKAPGMADLRQSGSIEQDADMVLLLHRESYQNKECPDDRKNILEVNLAKNRNGPTGYVELEYRRNTGTIRGIANPENQDESTEPTSHTRGHWQD